jgi:hypothetical protein
MEAVIGVNQIKAEYLQGKKKEEDVVFDQKPDKIPHLNLLL